MGLRRDDDGGLRAIDLRLKYDVDLGGAELVLWHHFE
jgi:hypothetical protein